MQRRADVRAGALRGGVGVTLLYRVDDREIATTLPRRVFAAARAQEFGEFESGPEITAGSAFSLSPGVTPNGRRVGVPAQRGSTDER